MLRVNPMRIFAMITTRASSEYTPYALESFFRCTPFGVGDRFLLIDNDRSGEEPSSSPVELIPNPQPKSFAANVNQILELADASRADVFFLNNDLIFTEGWLEPLLADEPSLLSPLSNREVQYQTPGFVWKNALSLEDYLGREQEFAGIAREHSARSKGYKTVISLPFFCIKLPHAVYSALGPLDESFGKGGAEDNDYCIRACLAGFKVRYALASYVLHFSGKSTWSGAESAQETQSRCEMFRDVFEKKWGRALLDVYINEDLSVLNRRPDLVEFARREDFGALLAALLPPGKSGE